MNCFLPVEEMNVAVIARVPFDEGTLTGTLTKDSTWPEGDWRNTYFVPENLIPEPRACRRTEEVVAQLESGTSTGRLPCRNLPCDSSFQSRRQHNHSRHAQASDVETNIDAERCRSTARRIAGTVAETPLGT